MTPLAWGQPDGGVTQFAYFVEDLEAAAADLTARLGVGPWFVRGPFQPDARLRRRSRPGKPSPAAWSACDASLQATWGAVALEGRTRERDEREEPRERRGGERIGHGLSSRAAGGGGTSKAGAAWAVGAFDQHQLAIGICLLERAHVRSPVD